MDRERPLEARLDRSICDPLTVGLGERDLHQIDANAQADEVGHLPGWDACGDLDDEGLPGLGDEELRKGDPVAEPERADGVERDGCRRFQGSLVKQGGVEVSPADAEADAGRTQAIGECEQGRASVPGDDDGVQLVAVDELLEDRALRA